MLLQGLQDKSLKYIATRRSYVVRENNEDLTNLVTTENQGRDKK